MLEDENEPKTKIAKAKNLEPLSIDELDDYIGRLEAEIVRAKAEIVKKKAYTAAASSFFKS